MCQTQGCIILDDIPDALLCFPLSHTKSLSISYHQECRVNPNLLTHLDDGVTRFLFSPPANWDFPWSLFHIDTFEVHLDVDLKTRIEAGDPGDSCTQAS